ncbi:MAG: Phosphoribosyl-AMP cyclohydrolase / Phosphoribosyl-ATP pyrophosphatase [uncultured Chloroflexia bacterium]|uniref:Histidine biosynthesis bifunctional protein HisIE n=1 Tax=uncultured Chloroflexia bacterium TaxID=1672391 RepID=A0A6J4JC62_9CHLR|nr:MAG: Phosphoribosyl-AMP cyclohydrolase / Phosphoribosyl-ATP pyrophosphatase [uncultured Chloroflexia bacterium]
MKFDDKGLIPAIVQHARSGEVLMLGYMNQESIDRTRASGLVTFWSRSRGAIWQKGATSGNTLRMLELREDCDGDALLILVEPDGPTCHTGARSCFEAGSTTDNPAVMPPSATLTRLADVIRDRRARPVDGSYTVKLLDGGVDRLAKKVGEEATEVVIGAMKGDRDELRSELADLVYHVLVLVEQQGLPIEEVWRELDRRYAR